MKIFQLSILGLLFIFLTSCKKNKPESTDNPYGLPNITQSGKNTFGCLIDGNLFLSQKSLIYPTLACDYKFRDKYPIKGYYFNLSAKSKSENYYSMEIKTINKAIDIGEFELGPPEVEGSFSAVIYTLRDEYLIKDNNKGKIKIINFDAVKKIVSGTFWFDAVNNKGEKVEVREGRFDMLYNDL